MSFIEQLADFDKRRGRTPIDPTKIEGFGEGNPPAPRESPRETPIPTARELHGDPLEAPSDEQAEAPLSPLVEAGIGHMPVVGVRVGKPPETAGDELWVRDAKAAYRGRYVELDDHERNEITKVVLKAIRRSLDEQYLEVAGRLPRRTAKPTAETEPKPRRRRRASEAKDAAS